MPQVTFSIERNPEPEANPIGSPCAFGVWEKVEETPDEDEIVAAFPSLALAEQWITEHTPVTEEYLKSRGII